MEILVGSRCNSQPEAVMFDWYANYLPKFLRIPRVMMSLAQNDRDYHESEQVRSFSKVADGPLLPIVDAMSCLTGRRWDHFLHTKESNISLDIAKSMTTTEGLIHGVLIVLIAPDLHLQTDFFRIHMFGEYDRRRLCAAKSGPEARKGGLNETNWIYRTGENGSRTRAGDRIVTSNSIN